MIAGRRRSLRKLWGGNVRMENGWLDEPSIRSRTYAWYFGSRMRAWGVAHDTGENVLMLADGNADLAKALGLEFDGSAIGFGIRSQRYALVANDGVVEVLAVEAPMKFEVSSAEAILEKL